MIPHHVYYHLAVVRLLWLCLMLHYLWPNRGALSPPLPAESVPPQRKHKRSNPRSRGLNVPAVFLC